MASPDTTAYRAPAPTRPRRDALLRGLQPKPAGDGEVVALNTPPVAGRAIEESLPQPAVRRRDAIYRRALASADVLAAAGAVLLAVPLLGDDALRPLGVLSLPLVVLAAKAQGVYDRDELVVRKTTIDEAPQLFQLATLYTLLFVLLQGAFVVGRLGPTQIVGLWAALFVLTVAARCAARGVAARAVPVERCLFVGGEAACERLRGKLESHGGQAEVVGRMSLDVGAPGGDLLAEVTAALHALVVELRVDRVIIEPGEPLPEATLDFVREVKATGARVSLLPRVLEVVGSSIEVDDVHGLTLLGVRSFGLSRSSAALKRGLDLAGAGIALVLFSPVLAIAALAIRLDSPGPIIYRQTRVGRGGRPFTMWKLRTMVVGADALKPSLRALNEADGLFKIVDDPRLTRVGRVLRRLCLDEVPQLVNVLRGEMSLVGPRPLVTDDDARITGLDRRRLHLVPGMTGHWQILGSARVPLAEMVKLDYLYIAGWSLWSDVKILLRTVPYVLARRGM
jgi:exopolysaccharide biosynthesis polyprenyl glycosylphosphotransferase